jgi:phosphoglycerol transferase MdoB-like AlkP superfamily enzyme
VAGASDMRESNKLFKSNPKVNIHFIEIISILLLSGLEFYFLQSSCSVQRYQVTFARGLLNVCLLVLLNLVLLTLLAQLKMTIFLSLFLCASLAIINYYTICLHGSPLNIDEVENVFAAFDALSGYDIQLDQIPAIIVVCFCLICLILVFFKRNDKLPVKRFTLHRTVLFVAASIYIVLCYALPSAIRPKYVITWSWQNAYGTYGYVTCCIEDIYSRSKVIVEPDDYEMLETYNLAQVLSNKNNADRDGQILRKKVDPDIILILNETFYDLNRAANVELDEDPFVKIHSMDDLYHGYVVVPTIGGGTNRSEYELLTSNSLSIMRSNITPFNLLNLKDANSIVSCMNELGYVTIGAHPAIETNYNRNNAYFDLGFDQVYFKPDFKDVKCYRQYISDECAYSNLIEWYENSKEEGPVFAYLLTIQNHGDYAGINQAPELIHDNSGLFSDPDMTDEFITSVSKSDEAFFALTEYFKNSDRPVIIGMVGDHCPAFAKELLEVEHDDELDVLLRETPAYIWANYDLGIQDYDIGEMSLISFVPLMLKMAGIPNNPYYDYILQLKENVPIFTVNGEAYTSDHKRIPDGSEFLKTYQQLEYFNIKNTEWE